MFKFIQTALAQDLIACPDGTKADPAIGCVSTPGSVVNPDSDIVDLILGAASALLTVVITAAVIGAIYGAIKYAAATGNDEKIQHAKRILFWSIFGLAIGLIARIVVGFVLSNIA